MVWNNTENKFNDFITDVVEFDRPKHFFLSGSDRDLRDSVFAQSPFISNVLVFKLDCSS